MASETTSLKPHGAFIVTKLTAREDSNNCLVEIQDRFDKSKIFLTNEELDALCEWWASNRTKSTYILKDIKIIKD